MPTAADWVVEARICAIFAVENALVPAFSFVAFDRFCIAGKDIIELFCYRQKVFKITWIFDTLENQFHSLAARMIQNRIEGLAGLFPKLDTPPFLVHNALPAGNIKNNIERF